MKVEQLENVEGKIEKFIDSAIAYAPILISSLVSAALVLFLGLWLIRMVRKLVDRIFVKSDIEPSIRTFLGNLINWILKVMLFIVVVSQLGVQTSTFIAVIGAAGLAIGMSLQGSLSNFAGGVLILVFKPFKIGDLIESNGQTGVVNEIQIFNTRLNNSLIIFIQNYQLTLIRLMSLLLV